MKTYCIQYTNAGSGEQYLIKRHNAHEAFLEAIEVTDNPSNYNVEFWIENR